MKKAFTLAEVLITLTIIGVIAAITIPTLMKKYQGHATYVALKKSYSILSNVTSQLFAEYGKADEWTISGAGDSYTITNPRIADIKDFYISHMKVTCIENPERTFVFWPQNPKCMPKLVNSSSYKALNDGVFSRLNNSSAPFSTADGTIYYLWLGGWTSREANSHYGLSREIRGTQQSYFWIFVDTNGKKAPNKLGRDLFAFALTSKGLIPVGNAPEIADSYDCNKATQSGYACAGRVLKEGGINY